MSVACLCWSLLHMLHALYLLEEQRTLKAGVLNGGGVHSSIVSF